MSRPATCKERSRARRRSWCASVRNRLSQRRKGAKKKGNKELRMKHCRIALMFGVFVAIGAPLSSQDKKEAVPGIVVDKPAKTITINAKIAPRKLQHLKGEIYPLEVIATWAHPKGKKAHETIVTIDDSIKPSEIHKALESLGLKAGTAARGQGRPQRTA